MKIRNSLGHLVDVPKKHEVAIRKHIQSGNHQKVSDMVDSFKPKMADGGKTGHNWAVPQYGWGRNGVMVGPYQDGGQMPDPGQQQQAQGAQGQEDPQQQQIMQIMEQVEQALQQGASPKEIVKTLVKEGLPKEAAEQVIQQVISQSAQEGQQGQPSQGQAPQQGQQDPSQQQPPQAQAGLRMKQAGGGDQLTQMIGQALQQGQKPEAVMQMLVQKGVKPEQAQQMIQQVMQQLQPPTAQLGLNPNPASVSAPWAAGTDNSGAPATPDSGPTWAKGPSGVNPAGSGAAPVTPPIQHPGFKPMYTGQYYADHSIYDAFSARNAKNQATTDSLSNDPAAQKRAKYENRGAKAFTAASVGSGVGEAMNDIGLGLGIAGKFISNGQDRKQEMEQQYYNNTRDRQPIRPETGNNSAPAFSQFGGKYPRGSESKGYTIPYGTLPFQTGGQVPTEGTDFQSSAPNVMTERGETITDPTKGPVGPDGQPTGAVVHDTTGDTHADPSGGNAYNLGPDSVVHSKVLGIKVGDFLANLKGAPNAAYIAAKITSKYGNPDKEVSYADLAKLFETKKLADEVEKIGQKLEKVEDADKGNQFGKVTQVTNDLNKQTLGRQLSLKKQQMALNTDIAGSQGPIHNVSEQLKMSGAYGDKVQRETMNTAQGNPPTAGSGLKMKGRKMLLPTAQYGGKDFEDALGQVYTQSAQQVRRVPTSDNDDPNFPGSQPVDMSGTPLASSPVSWADIRPDTSKYNYQTGPTASDINNVNIGKFYKQYQERGAVSPGWLDEFSGAVEKGDIRIPASVDNWEAYNQTLNKDGTYGPGSREYILNKEQEPGMEYMRNIANKYGERHFDPTNMQLWKDPVTGQMVPKGKLMMRDFEKQTNDAYKAQGAQPYFKEDESQPFGSDMFGAHHMSVAPWVNQSYGGSGDSVTNDPDMPIIYNQTQNKAVPSKEDKKSDSTESNSNSGVRHPRSVYQEGLNPLNVAAPIAGLFMRRDPAPYIEDQGAKNALAQHTKQQFYNNQADKQDMERAYRAQTEYNPQNTPWVTAQAASNKYAAQNKSNEQAANINAEIQKRYEDQQIALTEKAGTNKAAALDSLAKRAAQVRWKDSALTLNSIGDIGKAYMENKLENRKAAIYQGMFKNASYDPITGTYIGNASADLFAGSPDEATLARARGETSLDADRDAKAVELMKKGDMEAAHALYYGRAKWKQLGGKVKRIPARMAKKRK